jgi:adenosine deaminase/aminodeoxyfutalosine deaminase
MNLRDLPKAELHLHLEGSAEPETLCELDPALTLAEIHERYRYGDFRGFVESFKWVLERLKGPEDFALIARRLLNRLASENVRYAEITLSAGVNLLRRQDFAGIFEAVRREAETSPVRVRWILDAIRQLGAEHAREVAELAAGFFDQGVVGFGIGGIEELGPAEWFGEVFRFARTQGLHLTAHAGESMGPESVWAALGLGAERIGHGIRAVEDPTLLIHLREHGIPLEICVSSNVATGAVARLAEHPVRRIFDAGVPIVISTDDPGMFRTTLTREYELLRDQFGFTQEELRGLAENSFRYAFAAGT